jgi:hypothetical protein
MPDGDTIDAITATSGTTSTLTDTTKNWQADIWKPGLVFIMDALAGLGADARVGFTEDIFSPEVYWFSRYFWQYTMRDGKTIADALDDAGAAVGGGGGISSIDPRGNLGQTLRPAIYGQ